VQLAVAASEECARLSEAAAFRGSRFGAAKVHEVGGYQLAALAVKYRRFGVLNKYR